MNRSAWFWAGLVLLGCPKERPRTVDAGTVDAGVATLIEVEPNNRPAQAMPLSRSTRVEAGLGLGADQSDQDWYQLSSDHPTLVDLSASGIPGSDVVLSVHDRDGNVLGTVNGEGEGKPERIPNLGVFGTILVQVSSAKRGSGGMYVLTALFKEPTPGLEAEPNDRAVDANAETLGETVSGFFTHAADEDWYRYELPGNTSSPAEPAPFSADAGTESTDASTPTADASVSLEDGGLRPDTSARVALRIELSAPAGVRPEIRVLSAAQALLFQARGVEEAPLQVRNVGVRAADRVVYVVVASAPKGPGKETRRGYNADVPYGLTVSVEEASENAEYEPNDDPGKATSLPERGFRQGFLSPRGDVDYYLVGGADAGLFRLELSGVDRLDLVLSVVRPMEEEGKSEEVLLRANDGALREPEILNDVFCTPTCTVKVEGAPRKVDGQWVRDFENSDDPYRLSVEPVADVASEEHEPNNSPATATPLSLVRPVRGTVHPKKDVDYFLLDLSARPVRTAIRARLTGILKVDVGLYLYRQGDGDKLVLVQAAERAKGDRPELIRYSAEPAAYLLEVRDSSKRPEANFQDSYQLVVEEGD